MAPTPLSTPGVSLQCPQFCPPAHTVAVSQPHGPALRGVFSHLSNQR